MPGYKLCYFNARGVGELIRLLFAEAQVQYEDIRYERPDWPNYKQEMLFNQIPVLFVDGEQIAHSRAAYRYLARKFDLLGDDELTAAKIDMWIEVLFESMEKLPFSEKDEKKKAEKIALEEKDHLGPNFAKFEAMVKSNKDGVYAFGKKATAIDIFLFGIADVLRSRFNPKFIDKYPHVKALVHAVGERPNIAKWVSERPATAG